MFTIRQVMDIYFQRITATFFTATTYFLISISRNYVFTNKFEKNLRSLHCYSTIISSEDILQPLFCNYTCGLITQKKNKFTLWSVNEYLCMFFTWPIVVLYNTNIFYYSRSLEKLYVFRHNNRGY